jgi:voltage-gated potassium channel Kch
MFLALFFISLGMGLNLDLILSNWYVVFGGLVGLIAIKFFAIFMVARVRGVNLPDATLIALMLAQGGEFALLMLQTMKSSGIEAIPSAHKEILTAIIVLSIMITPLLLWGHDYLQRKGKLLPQKMTRSLDKTEQQIKPDVIVCGFGRVGQIVCQMLDAKDIPYVAIDLDVNAVMMGREQGFNVVYGDATNQDVLREFGLQPRKVKSAVVALDNATTARKSILTIKSIAPRIRIFARARNLADSKMFLSEGVDVAMPETIESSFFIGYSVLEHVGVLDSDIEELLHDMRQNDYVALSTVISDKQD